MKLRITSDDARTFVVENAETGERLEGVKSVSWSTHWAGHPKVELVLTDAAIDVSIDASRVDAITREDGKFAHTKLVDIARLRWRR
jgi:hypothetical protein